MCPAFCVPVAHFSRTFQLPLSIVIPVLSAARLAVSSSFFSSGTLRAQARGSVSLSSCMAPVLGFLFPVSCGVFFLVPSFH